MLGSFPIHHLENLQLPVLSDVMKTSDKESMLEYWLSFETDPEFINSEISFLYCEIDEFLNETNI